MDNINNQLSDENKVMSSAKRLHGVLGAVRADNPAGTIDFKSVNLNGQVNKIVTDSIIPSPNHHIHLERQVYALLDENKSLVGFIGPKDALHDVVQELGDGIVLVGTGIKTGTPYTVAPFDHNVALDKGLKPVPRPRIKSKEPLL